MIEVVHGKRAMLAKMPGNTEQQFANLRAARHMWARPGKKHLFMGNEIGQRREWDHDTSLDWHLLRSSAHRGLQALVRDLNHLYREQAALWQADIEPTGFEWIEADADDDNIIAFMRIAPATGSTMVSVSNFSPVHRGAFRVGVPRPGWYREILNTDAAVYGGGNRGNFGGIESQAVPYKRFGHSICIELPPLSTVWFLAPEHR